MKYAIWEACVEVGVRPPGCKECWEDCDTDTQALMIAFKQTRDADKAEIIKATAGHILL